jgi:hypothetical protein
MVAGDRDLLPGDSAEVALAPTACAVCGDDLTPHGHWQHLFALMGCHDATGCCKVCAHCVGRDLSQLMVDGAKLLLHPQRVLHFLAAGGLVEPLRVTAWSARQREVEAAIAAHAARRASRPRDFALVGSRVEGCHVKRCPSCGAACIKVDGCNQVSCSLCHESFRWCCMALGTVCTCESDLDGPGRRVPGSAGRGRRPVAERPVAGRGGLRRPLIRRTWSPPPRDPALLHPGPVGWTPPSSLALL